MVVTEINQIAKTDQKVPKRSKFFSFTYLERKRAMCQVTSRCDKLTNVEDRSFLQFQRMQQLYSQKVSISFVIVATKRLS